MIVVEVERRRFLKRGALLMTALAAPALTYTGCRAMRCSPDRFDATHRRLLALPQRQVSLEIGAPLDASIAPSSPGILLHGTSSMREFDSRGVHVISDTFWSWFPDAAYREVTPALGMGSIFSPEVVQGPIHVTYGLGAASKLVLPPAWRVAGRFHAGHLTFVTADLYLVPEPLDTVLARVHEIIAGLKRIGWAPYHDGTRSLEEAELQFRAARVPGAPMRPKSLAFEPYLRPDGLARCEFLLRLATPLDQPVDCWGYGLNLHFSAPDPLIDKLEAITKRARQQLRIRNLDFDVHAKQPGYYGYEPDEWIHPEPEFYSKFTVDAVAYLQALRAAGLTAELDPRWR